MVLLFLRNLELKRFYNIVNVLSFVYFDLNYLGNSWNFFFKFMVYDSIDFLYFYEKFREFMGKSNFLNLGEVKKYFKKNWGWFVNDKFVWMW